MTRTRQTNDRKIEVLQSPKSEPARGAHVPPVRNPNVITGPQVSREERATSRLDELRRNTPPQNIAKETTSQQAAPVRSSILPERKIDAPERKIEVQGRTPAISVNEQPVGANIIGHQTPKPSDNARSISPIQSNSPALASQTQLQKNEDKPVARVMKPQETRPDERSRYIK